MYKERYKTCKKYLRDCFLNVEKSLKEIQLKWHIILYILEKSLRVFIAINTEIHTYYVVNVAVEGCKENLKSFGRYFPGCYIKSWLCIRES